MAVVAPSASSPGNLEPKPDQSSDTHTIEPKLDCPPKDNPNPSSLPPPVATITEHSNPNPNPVVITPPAPPVVPSFTPSFRPVLGAPQFSPVPNPSMQNPNLQPPGVAPQPTSVTVSPYPPPGVYYSAPGQLPGIAPRPYWQGPNGYMGVLPRASQGQGLMPPPECSLVVTLPVSQILNHSIVAGKLVKIVFEEYGEGIPRYPAPYPMMVRPGFPPRAPVPIGVITSLGRPFVPGVSGALTIPSVVRPVVPIVAPAEKPQTTVYVGKIASTVENDFLLSLLRLCGPVKSWKRAQDPSDGTPRGFGFCEFESAEGVLRALRLLTKLNIDGQELVLNVNQATRTYLERYVEKKTERENLKETEGDVTNGESTSSVVQKQGSPKEELLKKDADDPEVKEKQDNHQEFGIVTEEDRDTDGDALEKIKNMLEERLKTRPLPPPPSAIPSDGPSKSNSELPSKPEEEINLDATRSSEDKNEDDETSEGKPRSGRDKFESLSDKSRIRERSRERDRDRDIKRDKEKELERYEWERERERARRERERDLKIREAERWYKDRVKEWEAREREKEYQRQYEREREKERESKRRRDILEQEDESDDEDTRKRRHRSSAFVEKKRKVQREKEEDHADRLREEEEIAEAKKRAAEEKKKKDHLKASVAADAATNGRNIEGAVEDKMDIDRQGVRPDDSRGIDVHAGDDAHIKGNIIESDMESISISETKQSNNTISKKLGFGLAASGKRTSVLSVFHEEEDEDVDKDKMGPLVPIDYSTEELQAVHIDISGTPPNLVAAAEFAKRISGDSKEDKTELERDRDRNRRNTERQRERERTDDGKYTKNESRERIREKNHERDREQEEKPRVTENKKLLDAKQLIDMIPKTKNELFSYEINWSIYDKHELHARMRPWISKKITEFLGEEEATFVDYIVSSTKDHVQASEMLQLLQPILDEEAEMFVLKMWRMLIFEIKKVETGISTKSRS